VAELDSFIALLCHPVKVMRRVSAFTAAYAGMAAAIRAAQLPRMERGPARLSFAAGNYLSDWSPLRSS
jgi:hypothetical protein